MTRYCEIELGTRKEASLSLAEKTPRDQDPLWTPLGFYTLGSVKIGKSQGETKGHRVWYQGKRVDEKC